MDRKKFLIDSCILFIPGFEIFRQSADSANFESDPISIKTIEEFVKAGHNDLKKVKEMLNAKPNLISCRYDWGNGDFEEAIEGAAHVGNKEIATYLISQGARINLFVLTMLGENELVKPILKKYPKLIFSKGPHGFTLLHHANIGKNQEMTDFLIKEGLTVTKFST